MLLLLAPQSVGHESKSDPMRLPSPAGFRFFFQAEDGIRDLVRSRGLGDVYKRQAQRLVGGVDGDPDPERADGLGEPHIPVRGRTGRQLSLIHI